MTLHRPVMVKEVLEMLAVKRDGVYVDGTAGTGGHSRAVLELLGPKGRLVSIDKDEETLALLAGLIQDERYQAVKGDFADMDLLLQECGHREVDGIVLDLGMSMVQVKNPGRGFSFNSPHRLDMRMDLSSTPSAWDIVNRYTPGQIEEILKEYGEEWRCRAIADAIVRQRKRQPVDTCVQLAEIVAGVYGGRGKSHPATKTFQALRIAVNRELDALRSVLGKAPGLLNKGGRLCVISYHSLEDRIVKEFFKGMHREGLFTLTVKKPLRPGLEEVRENPAARSAKIRGGIRL